MTDARLPSWLPGPTRDAVLAFLDAAPSVPVAERVAYFDNDGTLWAERPSYVQLDFLIDALRRRVGDDAALAKREEFAALLSGDQSRIDEVGLPRIAMALVGLFDGVTPASFTAEARDFMGRARHDALDRPLNTVTYAPMMELIGELRALEFTVGIVTGGGTEFVRAISQELYGVPPELVVGTMIHYDFTRDDAGRPQAVRGADMVGDVNEGPAKVTNIQSQLGRKPIFAAGNSAGDKEMLEWACATDGPHLAILIDHDDAEREAAYVSEAVSVANNGPITEVGRDLGWTVVSMKEDWASVFSPLAD